MRPHLFLALDDARVGAGIDDVVEGLFTDMVLRPDITAQNLAVGEAAAGMFIVNAYNVLYSERVAASYNPVSTFFHTSEIIIP